MTHLLLELEAWSLRQNEFHVGTTMVEGVAIQYSTETFYKHNNPC